MRHAAEKAIGEAADGVVVGSAIVAAIAQCYDDNGKRIEDPAEAEALLEMPEAQAPVLLAQVSLFCGQAPSEAPIRTRAH